LATFVALLHWPPLRQQPDLLVLLLLLLGVGLALVGPAYFSVEPDKILDLYQKEEFHALDGTSEIAINPKILGAALALILTLSIALLLRRDGLPGRDGLQGRWLQGRWLQGRWRQVLLIGAIAVMGNSLIISQSRSSWLALLIVGTLLPWLLGKRWLTLLLVSMMIACGALLWFTEMGSRLPLNGIASSAWDSFVRRQEIWRFSLGMVASNPVTGVGLGAYEQAFVTRFPSLPLTGGQIAPPHAHNLLLQIALDLGVPGFIAWVGLWLAVSRRLLHSLAQEGMPRNAQQVGLLATFISMALIGCFDNALWGTKLTFLPFIFLALAYIVSRQPDSRQ